MAKCIYFGLARGHDSRYGISHSNIAKYFTRLNWNHKAIVRDGHYICIKLGKYSDNKGREIKRYFIDGCPNKKGFIEEHKYLKDAIQMANNYSKNQGELPDEFKPVWTIFAKNRGYMKKIGEFKPIKKRSIKK